MPENNLYYGSKVKNMKLLSEEELVWSPVVANNRMNRKRVIAGVNSYEKEFGLSLQEYLDNCLTQGKKVKWLDLCCGEGNALLQYAMHIAAEGQQDKVQLRGIDLVDEFQTVPSSVICLDFEVQAINKLVYGEQYDLITCVHGLHYVGDKLAALTAALKALTETGLFLANLDLNSIKIMGEASLQYLQKKLKDSKVTYNGRKKVVSCTGPRDIDFGLKYQGADESAGPNYTGQEAVDSYYLFE